MFSLSRQPAIYVRPPRPPTMSALELKFGQLALVGAPKRRRDEGESSAAGAARATVEPLECVCCGDLKTPVLVCKACRTVCCKECYLRYFTDSPGFSKGAIQKSSLAHSLAQKVHVDAPACMEPTCRRVFTVEELRAIMTKEAAKHLIVESRRIKLEKQDAMFISDTIEYIVPLCHKVDVLYAELEHVYADIVASNALRETHTQDVDRLRSEIKAYRKTITTEAMDIIRGIRGTTHQGGEEKLVKRSVACTQQGCAGMFKYDAATDTACMICNVRHCRACLARMDEGHVCDAGAVESAKLILNTTKPCPTCATPISKTFGCDQMMCMNPTCHAVFSWKTGLLEVGGVHNPYIYTLSKDMQETVRARTLATGAARGAPPPTLSPRDAYTRRNATKHTAPDTEADRLQLAAIYNFAWALLTYNVEEQRNERMHDHEASLEVGSRLGRLEMLLKKKIFVDIYNDTWYDASAALAILRARAYTDLELKQVEAKKSANSLRMDTRHTNMIGKFNAVVSFLGVFTVLSHAFVDCDDATFYQVARDIIGAMGRLREVMGDQKCPEIDGYDFECLRYKMSTSESRV